MRKELALFPSDRRKSFYGKAKVICEDDRSYILMSYNTEVARVDVTDEGAFLTRLWHGWSITTQRHFNAFMDLLGFYELDYKGKSVWDMFPVGCPIAL